MKKNTIPAAKKAAKKAVKKTATKAAPEMATVQKTASKTSPAKKAPAKKAAAKQAAQAPNTPKTTIVANVDVGFGNSLYLRGDAPGLSWSKGVPMDCQADSSWSMTIAGVSDTFEFKVLINDSFWSAGYNETAHPGETLTITPQF